MTTGLLIIVAVLAIHVWYLAVRVTRLEQRVDRLNYPAVPRRRRSRWPR